MSNVKPQVGQKWDVHTPNINLGIVEIKLIDGDKVTLTNEIVVSVSGIHENCEFIPQNDLEWLAANHPMWGDFDVIRKDTEGLIRFHNTSHPMFNKDSYEWYNRQQWQNMRYKLGLDKKPHVSGEEWANMLKQAV